MMTVRGDALCHYESASGGLGLERFGSEAWSMISIQNDTSGLKSN